MTLRKILNSLDPIDTTEELFCRALYSVKSSVHSSRDLVSAFLKGDTLYPEAVTLAEKAYCWMHEWEQSYQKLHSKNSESVLKIEKEEFLKYCRSKDWFYKENKTEIVARDRNTFKASYDLFTKEVKLKASLESKLDLIKHVNSLLGE